MSLVKILIKYLNEIYICVTEENFISTKYMCHRRNTRWRICVTGEILSQQHICVTGEKISKKLQQQCIDKVVFKN